MLTQLQEELINYYNLDADFSCKSGYIYFFNQITNLFDDLDFYLLLFASKKYGFAYVTEKIFVALARGQLFGDYLKAALAKDWKINFYGSLQEWNLLIQDERIKEQHKKNIKLKDSFNCHPYIHNIIRKLCYEK